MTALGQTIVVDPALTFAELSRRYAGDGWRIADQAQRPLVPGEPEFAGFERDAERVVYTFNPVCMLRVLDCSGAGDAAGLPDVPAVGVDEVSSWLGSEDERTVLRGILAAGLLGTRFLAPLVQAHRDHPRRAIADAAARVAMALAHDSDSDGNSDSGGIDDDDVDVDDTELQAHAHALAAIAVLERELRPMLHLFAQSGAAGDLMASLRPRPEDYALAFEPDVVEAARALYEPYWASPPRLAPADANSEVQVHVAPAGMLGFENHLSRRFPGGYAAIASLLQPQRAWVAWKLIPRGQTAGISYDGLVWLDDHWAWFPKPYRVLRDLVTPEQSPTPP